MIIITALNNNHNYILSLINETYSPFQSTVFFNVEFFIIQSIQKLNLFSFYELENYILNMTCI